MGSSKCTINRFSADHEVVDDGCGLSGRGLSVLSDPRNGAYGLPTSFSALHPAFILLYERHLLLIRVILLRTCFKMRESSVGTFWSFTSNTKATRLLSHLINSHNT
ncbi:hypothetical protein L596_030200 [Steinernema carpocapsae]|uniref:Uncharacterized protein n=1 Tax=Steinernema carpocapsae TaxID=34508 RepID=A0A4U5LS07_STECR|nr:hypothetical protein L596_030200 [Steinernema carpocapsae]